MTGSAPSLGLLIGLLTSAVVVAALTVSSGMGPPSRPDSVPAEAIWSEAAFGQRGWVHCASDKGIVCRGFNATGVEVVVASYVPRDGKAPAAPYSHVVAADVERVWLNKVAMVPDGQVKFPHAGMKVDYANGRRRTDPGP